MTAEQAVCLEVLLYQCNALTRKSSFHWKAENRREYKWVCNRSKCLGVRRSSSSAAVSPRDPEAPVDCPALALDPTQRLQLSQGQWGAPGWGTQWQQPLRQAAKWWRLPNILATRGDAAPGRESARRLGNATVVLWATAKLHTRGAWRWGRPAFSSSHLGPSQPKPVSGEWRKQAQRQTGARGQMGREPQGVAGRRTSRSTGCRVVEVGLGRLV